MPMLVTDPGVADTPVVHADAASLDPCGHGREEVRGRSYFFLVGVVPTFDPKPVKVRARV